MIVTSPFKEATIQELLLDQNQIHDDVNVIIINKFPHDQPIEMELSSVNDDIFEIRTIVGTRSLGGGATKWDGITFSRHGGVHPKWWMDERSSNQVIQIDSLPPFLPYNDEYTLVYVRVKQKDFEKIRNQFLTNIGGQVHVQCAIHHLPLIVSMDRANKCVSCGRQKTHFCCCKFDCNIFLCRQCFEAKRRNTTTYIQPSPTTPPLTTTNGETLENVNDTIEDEDEDDDNSSRNSSSTSEEELAEPVDEIVEYLAQIEQNRISIEEGDNFDDFLMTSNDPDIDLQSDDHNRGGQDETCDPVELFIPSTNAGELARTITEETKYGGKSGNITISGHVLLSKYR